MPWIVSAVFLLSVASGIAQSPPAPTGVFASDGVFNYRILIKWDYVLNADRYTVYRSTSSDGVGRVAIGTTRTDQGWDSSYFYDWAPIYGDFYYWVVAANEFGESEFSDFDSGYRRPAPVEPPWFIRATDGDLTSAVRIHWGSVRFATEYLIYRSESSGGRGAILIGTVAERTFDDTSAIPGRTYYYRVRGSNRWGYSPRSSEDSGFRALPPAPPRDDFQPDCLIAAKPRELRGDGIYDPSGNRQKVVQRSKNGRRLTWFVGLQNDGQLIDTLRGRGLKGTRRFRVNYLAENQNITAAMIGGTYRLVDLSGGERRMLRIEVKPAERLQARQQARVFVITLTSTGDPLKRDKVRAIAKTGK